MSIVTRLAGWTVRG